MKDYRIALYEKYVSQFKDHTVTLSFEEKNRLWAAFEYRYLPYIQGVGKGSRILELGCGPGYLLQFLKEREFCNIQGIDVSAEQVDIAKELGCNAVETDVFEYLASAEGVYDVIIAVDFVEHFHREELIELLGKVEQALRRGGRFILQTPNGEGLFSRQLIYGDLTHCTIFTPNSLKQLLQMAGFVEVEFSETGPIPRNLAGKARLIGWKLVKLGVNGVRRVQSGKKQALWGDNVICCCRRPRKSESEEHTGSADC